jgi:hypothetical protein
LWFPAPGDHADCGYCRVFLETAGEATDAQLCHAARLARAALNASGLDAMLILDGMGGIPLLIPFDD